MAHTPLMKLLLIVMFAILLQYYSYANSVVEGTREVKLKDQLKILNKTPIKTIRTDVGDVYDCIDINKQPSLDHHLLKNHVIKTRPISHSINPIVDDDHHETTSSYLSLSSSSFVKTSRKVTILEKLDCPDETVPIRRISKEDLLRAKSFSKSQVLLSSINNVGDQPDDLENPDQGKILSIAKTRKDSGINYLGIAAYMNIYNPPVIEHQISAAQMWIENGPKEDFNSLQTGWMVAPSLSGDNKTRLFGKWQVDASNKSEGCYNLLCPGFIQVDKAHPIDAAISKTSQYGSTTQYEMKVAISQDSDGNWWLDIDDINIGYWPAELGFSQLTQGSSVIAWGGLAAQLRTITKSVPPTGNGHYPNDYEDFSLECFMRSMKVIPVKTLFWEDPTRKIIRTFTTKKQCSDIIYYGRYKRYGFEHTIVFGGPGGNY